MVIRTSTCFILEIHQLATEIQNAELLTSVEWLRKMLHTVAKAVV